MAQDFEYEVTKKIGIISDGTGKWQKEFNQISWSNRAPKYDIRDWHSDHSKMGKGITLTEKELRKLKQLIDEEIEKIDKRNSNIQRDLELLDQIL